MSEISDERLREYKANWEREIRALASHEIEGTYAIDMAAIIDELLAARPLLEAVREELPKLAEMPDRIQHALYEEYCGPELAKVQDDIVAIVRRIREMAAAIREGEGK